MHELKEVGQPTPPFCWKCKRRVEGPTPTRGFVLIGCKDCSKIMNYEDAKTMCPGYVPDK